MTSALFQPIRLRDLTLLYRIVISPMCQYSALDGRATDWRLIHLGHLDGSGAGLLIIEAAGVEPQGRISRECLGMDSADGEADMVALGRGMLNEPRWPWHAAEELGAQVRFPYQYFRAVTREGIASHFAKSS